MANVCYPLGLEKFLSGGIDYGSDTIKVRLMTSAYVYSASHEFADDLATSVGTDQTLGTKTLDGKDALAADSTWSAVAGGDTVISYAVYMDTGTPSTSPLIAFVDRDGSNASISIATSGDDITIQWTDGVVFSL